MSRWFCNRLLGALLALGFLPFPSAGAVYEPDPISVNLDELAHPDLSAQILEPPQSFWELVREQLRVGYGLDQSYTDNQLLDDGDPFEEYETTLEGELFLAIPRGNLLYGADYEINATRSHRRAAWFYNHDLTAFFDWDTGGRLQYRLNYYLVINEFLLFGPTATDVLERHLQYQRSVEHRSDLAVKYALTEHTSLAPQVEYSNYDLQTINDSNADRRKWRGFLDYTYEFYSGWRFYTGYEYTDQELPANKQRSSTSHGGRFGIGYELTELVNLDALLRIEKKKFRSGTEDTNLGFTGTYQYTFSPRTKILLSYNDEKQTSFAANGTQFRSTRPRGELTYELTPRLEAKLEAAYEKQKRGYSPTSPKFLQHSFSAGLKYELRENAKVTAAYSFKRSKTEDYTVHSVSVGFEAEF